MGIIASFLCENEKHKFSSSRKEVRGTSKSIEFEVDFLTWAKSFFREFIMSIRLCPVGEVISGYVVSARSGTFATHATPSMRNKQRWCLLGFSTLLPYRRHMFYLRFSCRVESRNIVVLYNKVRMPAAKYMHFPFKAAIFFCYLFGFLFPTAINVIKTLKTCCCLFLTADSVWPQRLLIFK